MRAWKAPLAGSMRDNGRSSPGGVEPTKGFLRSQKNPTHDAQTALVFRGNTLNSDMATWQHALLLHYHGRHHSCNDDDDYDNNAEDNDYHSTTTATVDNAFRHFGGGSRFYKQSLPTHASEDALT